MSGINKVIFAGESLIDLTSDTVDKEHLLYGYVAHNNEGDIIEGECTYDVDSRDATATVAEVLSGKTAYARSSKLTGTMTNNGAVTGIITERDEEYTIPNGYHDGSGKVSIDDVEKDKLVPRNIRKDITILGITGSMTGTEDVIAQAVTITPTKDAQTIVPESGYNYISQVTVDGIPYVEAENSAGGITVTIG